MMAVLCALALAPTADEQFEWLTGRLQGEEFREQRLQLVAAAPGIFPLLGRWLVRSGNYEGDVARVYIVLRDSPGDRSRFVPQAVQHLAHSDPVVRARAAEFIGRAGTAVDAAPLLTLLIVDDNLLQFELALRALERIGDERTQVSLEVWRRFDKRFRDRELAERVDAARGRIRARLEADKKKAAEKEKAKGPP